MSDSSDRPPWRAVVIERMFEATLEQAGLTPDEPAPVYNYRWEHVQAVVTLTLRLAEQVGADRDIVEAAAWLHDLRKEQGPAHPAAGAAAARELLAETDFPRHKIAAVAGAIAAHQGLWRDTPLSDLAAQVLWDADKLTKLGLTAAIHWLGWWLVQGDPLTTAAMVSRLQAEDWMAQAAASLHTAPARRAAVRRVAAYEALWRGLAAELAGQDLTSDDQA